MKLTPAAVEISLAQLTQRHQLAGRKVSNTLLNVLKTVQIELSLDFTVAEHLVVCELSVFGKQNAKFKVDRALRNDIQVKLSYHGYAGIQKMTYYLTNMTEKNRDD